MDISSEAAILRWTTKEVFLKIQQIHRSLLSSPACSYIDKETPV